MRKPKVLITGANGMVGKHLQELWKEQNKNETYSSFFLASSRDYDLRCSSTTRGVFWSYKPDYVIHLAAKVGGVKANNSSNNDFFTDNLLINTNVLNEAKNYNVKKVVCLLSSCVYPAFVNYPLAEYQLHHGEPHKTNYGYAYAKRMMEVQARTIRENSETDVICLIPNNLYGKWDNFDLENSHVVPALIRKFYEAKQQNKPFVELWGSGKSLREFTYANDLAEIIVWVLENKTQSKLMNVGNTKEVSIEQLALYIRNIIGYNGETKWKTEELNGIFRKPIDTTRLQRERFQVYEPLTFGLEKTIRWFEENYPNVRGVEKRKGLENL